MMTALASGTPLPMKQELNAYWNPLDQAIQNFIVGELTSEEALYMAEEEVYAAIEDYR
jgi:maltose-binding protein MalE